MPIILAVLQLVTAAVPPAGADPAVDAEPRPTIQFNARVRARELTIDKRGEARLEMRADPALVEEVEVTRNLPGDGRRTFRNLDLTLDAKATIDPSGRGARQAPQEPSASSPDRGEAEVPPPG